MAKEQDEEVNLNGTENGNGVIHLPDKPLPPKAVTSGSKPL